MSDRDGLIVLGSRSRQRIELLRFLVPASRIHVRPPADSTEPGFDDVSDWEALEARVSAVAREKNDDVMRQLATDGGWNSVAGVLTADTVIVGHADEGRLVVLGQPPDDPELMRQVVGEWFRRYYLGRTHTAATAVCLTTGQQRRLERVVRSEVTFSRRAECWLDWYLSTTEPFGKAGGYALQGAGDLFVDRVDGSPSNVIGLPLAETLRMLQELAPDVL